LIVIPREGKFLKKHKNKILFPKEKKVGKKGGSKGGGGEGWMYDCKPKRRFFIIYLGYLGFGNEECLNLDFQI
jgi:hypothetical protein